MRILFVIFTLTFSFFCENLNARESTDRICMKRGFEIILPYKHAIDEIKNTSLNKQLKLTELKNYKLSFERSFIGIDRYKNAGCSTSRLEEYMSCLVETDGKDCKIYYSQMRLVD